MRKILLILGLLLGSGAAFAQGGGQFGGGGGGVRPSSPCGDSSHALSWTGSAFGCQSITGSAAAGGSTTQLQFNNAGALGGISQWTTNGTTTVSGSSTAVFDLTALSTANLKFPTAFTTGLLEVTTATGALSSIAAPAGTIVGTTDTQTLTNKTLDGVTPTTMGFVDPTSSIQTQLNAKAALASPTFTGTVTIPALTLSGITGSTQCLHVNTSGVVSGTASDCGSSGGSGTVNSGTVDGFAYYTGSTVVSSVTPPTVNGAYTCGYNVIGSAAVVPTCPLVGVPVDSTNPATLLYSDRASFLNWTSGTALALPAVTSNFASNLPFSLLNTSGSTLTVTPNAAASDTCNGSATCTVANDIFGMFYSTGSAPGSWYKIGLVTDLIGVTSASALTNHGVLLGNGTLAIGATAAGTAGYPLTSGGSSADPSFAQLTGAGMANNTVTATQLAVQYSKGSCTEAWSGSGSSFAMQSGDDASSNNTCYNDSGVTRTITALKCRSDAASNTTTVNPTFGSAGSGTTILSGALTCGNSYAYSSSGTVSNASWTTGTGIDPAMGGTLTGTTSIAVIIEYTF